MNAKPLPKLLLPLLIVLGCAAPAWGQVKPVQEIEVRVLPQAEVFGESFTLGEIAEMDGFDLAALKRLSDVRIGRSPLPGRSIHINKSLIRSRLAAARTGLAINLAVPPKTRVVRAFQTVPGKRVAEIVLAAAERATPLEGKDELRQEILNPPGDAVLPKGKVSWKVTLMGDHLVSGGARTYAVRAIIDNRQVWKSAVRVRQKIYRQVVVAKRPIRRYQNITAADLTLVRKNISANRADPYLTSIKEATGRLARRPIGKYESLHTGLLQMPADVPEGGRVTMIYESGTLVLRVPGVAMVHGRTGQFIPVRNLESGKIVHGILQADDTVRVN
jgi:flagella basal body P-ring formation protein FlgA